MSIPNLGDAITKADIDTKGAGSYAADYIAWARVAHILQTKAPGWQFHLRPADDNCHVWKAPNGTAYVVGYFTGPDGEITPDFPQAVMDNRNAAIPFDKVSARDLTDTHRRCLCTAAAFTLGLAWQLWAKEPVEDPHRDDAPVKQSSAPAPAKPATAKKSPPPAPAPEPESPLDPPLDPAEHAELIAVLGQLYKTNPDAYAAFVAEFKAAFPIPDGVKLNAAINSAAHGAFVQNFLASLPPA